MHNTLIEAGYPTTIKDHNYKTKDGKYIDIVLHYNTFKIAIEYDGRYYHKNKVYKDVKRYKQLIKDGWKILCIRSNNNLPKISTIKDRINKLIKKSSYEVITCKDWYKSKTKGL